MRSSRGRSRAPIRTSDTRSSHVPPAARGRPRPCRRCRRGTRARRADRGPPSRARSSESAGSEASDGAPPAPPPPAGRRARAAQAASTIAARELTGALRMGVVADSLQLQPHAPGGRSATTTRERSCRIADEQPAQQLRFELAPLERQRGVEHGPPVLVVLDVHLQRGARLVTRATRSRPPCRGRATRGSPCPPVGQHRARRGARARRCGARARACSSPLRPPPPPARRSGRSSSRRTTGLNEKPNWRSWVSTRTGPPGVAPGAHARPARAPRRAVAGPGRPRKSERRKRASAGRRADQARWPSSACGQLVQVEIHQEQRITEAVLHGLEAAMADPANVDAACAHQRRSPNCSQTRSALATPSSWKP